MEEKEITNRMVLERLGWRVERDERDSEDWVVYDPCGRSGRIYEDEEHALENAPNYIGSLDRAITLTVPEMYLTLEAPLDGGEWMACFSKSGEFVDMAYDPSPARAICKAWLAAMDAIEKDQ